MPTSQVKVTFQPAGRSVYVLPNAKVLEAAGRAGMAINTPCGAAGTCGKCRVQIVQGACAAGAAEREWFSNDELAAGWRLACQATICSEAVIHVPDSSRFGGQHQILEDAAVTAAAELAPSVTKRYVELAAPTLEEDAPDLLRLERAIGPYEVELELLRRLPGRLREQEFRGTAVLADHRLIDVEAGDTTGQCYAVAFDVGTTTMVASLLDLTTGEERAIVSRMNPQVSYGDDVLSRIHHAGKSTDCLADLRHVVVAELSRMIDDLCHEAQVQRHQIYEVAFAGNTTMQHLLCGLDPSPLGVLPFISAYARGLTLDARDLDLHVHPRARAYVFPVIGGFLGGDTVAGILTTHLMRSSEPTVMVDVGTNGEIVLARDGQLWASSTAAGPAFEGARISCGMRATHGAIEKVVLDDDAQIGVIGNVAAVGLCGSGLIDLVAELLRIGIVTTGGRLLPVDQLPDSLPEGLRCRVQPDREGQLQFVIAEGTPGHVDTPVALKQRDIRELQLASGAIRAGIKILLKQAGLEPHELGHVLIAGGFGSFIRRSNAQQIGLFPEGLNRQQINYVGNVSLSGARWALLSTRAREHAEELARQTRHVELSTDPNFQMEFAEAMLFPEPLTE